MKNRGWWASVPYGPRGSLLFMGLFIVAALLSVWLIPWATAP